MDNIQKIRITSSPRNRFEMTVYHSVRNSGGKYLEIGAGSGNTLFTLLNYYDELVATELSHVRAESMTKLFKTVSNDKVKVIHNNIESDELDYPKCYFNTVVLNAVIEHVIEPIHVLKEVYKLTANGGRVIICTPNIAKYSRRIKLLLGYFPSTASADEGLLCYDGKNPTDLYDEAHLHYFTYRSLSKILKERVGFPKIEHRGYGLPVFSKLWPELFSDDVFVIAYK